MSIDSSSVESAICRALTVGECALDVAVCEDDDAAAVREVLLERPVRKGDCSAAIAKHALHFPIRMPCFLH